MFLWQNCDILHADEKDRRRRRIQETDHFFPYGKMICRKANMHGIRGKSWELRVPHFQRLVKWPSYQLKYLILFRPSSHIIGSSEKIWASGPFNTNKTANEEEILIYDTVSFLLSKVTSNGLNGWQVKKETKVIHSRLISCVCMISVSSKSWPVWKHSAGQSPPV